MVTFMFCPQCQSGSDDSTTEIPVARTDTDEWDEGEITCLRCLYFWSGRPDEPPTNQVFHHFNCPHCEFPMAINYLAEISDLRAKPLTAKDIRSMECLICDFKIKQNSAGFSISRPAESDADLILLRQNDMIREAQIHWRNTVQNTLNSTWESDYDVASMNAFEEWVRNNYFDSGE